MALTHFDENGNARMVDVSKKDDSERVAIATGTIKVSKEIFERIKEKDVEKGDVLTVATTAGIMGAKKTSDLIPMCHIIPLTHASIVWELGDEACDEGENHKIRCTAKVKCTGKTGVEMEALTAVSTALLTVYDMCKAIDKKMVIGEIYLKEKSGGKSGHIVND